MATALWREVLALCACLDPLLALEVSAKTAPLVTETLRLLESVRLALLAGAPSKEENVPSALPELSHTLEVSVLSAALVSVLRREVSARLVPMVPLLLLEALASLVPKVSSLSLEVSARLVLPDSAA